MRLFCRLAAIALCFPIGSVASQEAVSGAKDLFYDSVKRTTISIQLPATPAQPLLPITPVSTTPTGPAKPAHPVKARKVPQRRVAVAPPGAAASRARGLHYWVELEDAAGEGSYVSSEQVFHSGQRIRLHFVSNADGRIMLLQMGTSKTATLLFPSPNQGLADNRLNAGEERVLPSDSHWFRFDAQPGTEQLLVLFARDAAELERFRVKPEMGPADTRVMAREVGHVKGGKDLVIETETRIPSEVGTFVVNRKDEPVVLEISLRHQ
jgi:hypothetical protein